MSKLAKAVMAGQKDRRILQELGPLFNNTFDLKEDFSTFAHTRWAKTYRVEARFGAQVVVDEVEELKNPNALSFAVESCKRQIIHAVFGEFQEDIRLIEGALWERKFDEARTLLMDMERKMFTTE
jgi:hypothetical protein